MTHAELLARLLPPVSLDVAGQELSAELQADGASLDHAQDSVTLLQLEMDPRTADATLDDWERVYGLPEQCIRMTGTSLSVADRRAALVAKVGMQGGQSRAFFIALAAALGYTITITEWRPYSTEMDTEYGVTDEPWAFVWQVNSVLNAVRDFTTEDDTEMALAVWENALLECTIKRYKPAHTHVLFSYS